MCPSRSRARRPWSASPASPAAPWPHRRDAPSQSGLEGLIAAVSYEGARPEPCAARGRRTSRRPAARSSAAPAPARRPCWPSASPGWSRRRGAGVAARAVLLDRRGRRAARAARGPRSRARTRSWRSRRSTASARGCCTTRRSRPGSTRSPTPVSARRPARDAARAHRRAAAAPPRPARQPERDCWARSSSASTASRTSWSPPRTTRRGPRRCPRTRARASASSPPSTPRHDRMLAEAGTLDTGDLVLHALPAPARRTARARAARRAATGTCSSTSCRTQLRPGPAAAAARRRARQRHAPPATTTRRSTASAAPRPRTCRTSTPSGRRRRWCGWSARRVPASGPARRARGRRAGRGPDREGAARASPAARSRFWRCRQRARAGAGGGGRRRAADRARGRRARGRLRARALGARRGPGGRGRARGARRAVPARPAPRRSSSAPRCATCSRGCGCSSTPATPARSSARSRARRSSCARSTSRACTQIARRRKLDMVAALGAAIESPQIPPEARERILHFLRAAPRGRRALDSTPPDLYVHRLIERLGLRRQLLFAASAEVVERLRTWPSSPSSPPTTCAARRRPPAREFARSIAAVAEAGLREEEAAAGERPHGVQRDGDARRQGARVRPRLRARADGRAHARARAGARWSRSRTR